MTRTASVSIRLALLTLTITPLAAHATARSAHYDCYGVHSEWAAVADDSADVAAAVHAFHQALRSGDSTAALALLAPDVIILESGGVETLEQYRSGHLSGDIRFARAIESQRGPVRVTVRGDVAWASSTSTTQGEYNGRQLNSAGAELMVLTRTPQGWKIAAIHWSSRQRRP